MLKQRSLISFYCSNHEEVAQVGESIKEGTNFPWLVFFSLADVALMTYLIAFCNIQENFEAGFLMIISSVAFVLLAVIGSVQFFPWMTMHLVNNKKRVPHWLTSPARLYAYQAYLLAEKVNQRIKSWNYYCRGREVNIRAEMIGEKKVANTLDQAREETIRHLDTAKLYLEMEKDGEFNKIEDTENLIVASLEDVRELEDRLRRQVDSVNFDLNDALQVEARMAEVEEELRPKLQKARAQSARQKAGS